ncbi:MAG: Na+/H+ antiporter subunit B [Deltaproteobacteria bacterium]|nr:Na+/H+ antiporter subunit B [Deltaproteobacteria bacterium]
MKLPSIILRVMQHWLVPLLVVVSLFLLLRGHDEPGGGFAGGLMAAAAVILVALAETPTEARRLLRLHPTTLIALGLLVALVAGLIGPLTGKAFLTAVWLKADVGLFYFKAGTPLLFDIGVYLVVVGAVSTFALEIEEAAPLAPDRTGATPAKTDSVEGGAPSKS